MSCTGVPAINAYIKSEEKSDDIHHTGIGDLYTAKQGSNIYLYISHHFIVDNELNKGVLEQLGFELYPWTMEYRLKLK
jgi:hypothetical protein